jgi:hypothetical protein
MSTSALTCRSGIGLAVLLICCQTQSAAACTFDKEKLLALDADSFDQDMKGGWRAVAMQDNCKLVAADLIKEYRELRGPRTWRVMVWHEGQLRAMAGDIRSAIPLLEQSRVVLEETSPGWNEYVNATVAFLRKDRRAFDEAYASLLALPKPKGWDTNFFTKDKQWPLNRKVVESLANCFESSYEKAYSQCGIGSGK